MIREEQIKGLYALKEYLTKNPIELDGHKSLPITLIDYAIEALEQEPKNDLGADCIDRNSIKYYPGTGGYMYASKGEIDKLPSVIPQEPILEKIRAEILDNAFSVVNPKNTYEYINVLDLDSIERILNKYKADRSEEDGNDRA